MCIPFFPCMTLLVSSYKKPTQPASHFPQNSWRLPKARLTPTPCPDPRCGDRDLSGCKTLKFFHFCPHGGDVSPCSVLQQAHDALLTLALGTNLCSAVISGVQHFLLVDASEREAFWGLAPSLLLPESSGTSSASVKIENRPQGRVLNQCEVKLFQHDELLVLLFPACSQGRRFGAPGMWSVLQKQSPAQRGVSCSCPRGNTYPTAARVGWHSRDFALESPHKKTLLLRSEVDSPGCFSSRSPQG